jgi:hypothetical protein
MSAAGNVVATTPLETPAAACKGAVHTTLHIIPPQHPHAVQIHQLNYKIVQSNGAANGPVMHLIRWSWRKHCCYLTKPSQQFRKQACTTHICTSGNKKSHYVALPDCEHIDTHRMAFRAMHMHYEKQVSLNDTQMSASQHRSSSKQQTACAMPCASTADLCDQARAKSTSYLGGPAPLRDLAYIPQVTPGHAAGLGRQLLQVLLS